MDMAERKVFDLSQSKNSKSYTELKDVLVDSFALLEKLYNEKGSVTGVPTGFIDLDNKTAGLHNSDFIIVAARPAMGKSAFAINIATLNLPQNFLYFVQMYLIQKTKSSDSTGLNVNEDAVYEGPNTDFEHRYPDYEMPQAQVTEGHTYEPPAAQSELAPIDSKKYRRIPVKLVSH